MSFPDIMTSTSSSSAGQCALEIHPSEDDSFCGLCDMTSAENYTAVRCTDLKMEPTFPSRSSCSPLVPQSGSATADIISELLPQVSASQPQSAHSVQTFSMSRATAASVFSPLTFEVTSAFSQNQSPSGKSSALPQSKSASANDSQKRHTRPIADSSQGPQLPVHSVKRPSSLPIPSYMRTPRRPCTLSVQSANPVPSSPLSVQPIEPFILPKPPEDLSQTRVAPKTERSIPDSTAGNLKRHTPLQQVELHSPKRQRSVTGAYNSTLPGCFWFAMHNESSVIPCVTSSSPEDSLGNCRPNTFITKNNNLELAFRARCDSLLYPIDSDPISGDKMVTTQATSQAQAAWPPLVVSFHAELVLQYSPSPALLVSLLDCEKQNDVIKPIQWNRPQGCESLDDLNSKEASVQSSDWIPPGITLAITRNVHVYVHATQLSCCVKQSSWCFASRGFDSLGQNEVVITVRRRPQELLPPLFIYRYYQLLYLAMTDNSALSLTSDTITLERLSDPTGSRITHGSFLYARFPSEHSTVTGDSVSSGSSNEWAGLLLFKPTHQCLRGLQLPNSPFLFGTLVHSDEVMWARQVPLRLLLRLGKVSRSYPTPLVCDLNRKPVYARSSEASILDLVLNNNVCVDTADSPSREVCRLDELRIRLCSPDTLNVHSVASRSSETLEILIPAEAEGKLRRFISSLSSDCSTFILLGGLDLDSDSHLVCLQSCSSLADCSSSREQLTRLADSRSPTQKVEYFTEAISIANVARKKTGATFVVFSVASQFGVHIVEDGLLVQLKKCQFGELLSSLKLRRDFHLTQSVHDASAGSEFTVPGESTSKLTLKWLNSSTTALAMEPVECLLESWVDMQPLKSSNTYLVPLAYQLIHYLGATRPRQSNWETDVTFSNGIAETPRIVWSWVNIFAGQELASVTDQRFKESLGFGRLADEIAAAFTEALYPYAGELRTQNLTRIGLRVRLQPPDQVGFEVSGMAPDGASDKAIVLLSDQVAFSESLDSMLLPVLNSWVQHIRFSADVASDSERPGAAYDMVDGNHVLTLELHIYILD
ncbi:MAD mothers against decapentaplegic interacting protein [Clonorchis sinensis]|uniref:MAD mothers against decapentaplegic interacting protein n=1 Tax=Clonorchis sinensis TaxID=79923 RepID=G7YNB7_CLOSI|nr:MAD mothers against decapentaplegic interacting protein [Clonorchis sinensis]